MLTIFILPLLVSITPSILSYNVYITHSFFFSVQYLQYFFKLYLLTKLYHITHNLIQNILFSNTYTLYGNLIILINSPNI